MLRTIRAISWKLEKKKALFEKTLADWNADSVEDSRTRGREQSCRSRICVMRPEELSFRFESNGKLQKIVVMVLRNAMCEGNAWPESYEKV